MNRIIITVNGGLVKAVDGLPEGFDAEVRDFDTDGADDAIEIDGKMARVDRFEADGGRYRVEAEGNWTVEMGSSTNGDIGYVAYVRASDAQQAAALVKDALQGKFGKPEVEDFDAGSELVALRYIYDKGVLAIHVCFNSAKVTAEDAYQD